MNRLVFRSAIVPDAASLAKEAIFSATRFLVYNRHWSPCMLGPWESQTRMFDELVIRTKLTPPRPRSHTLRRPRLAKRLGQALDHRLTLVHAGTGYGKSTALAGLVDQGVPLCWYSIAPEDTDPFVFLLHLIYATRATLSDISDAPLAALERQGEQQTPTSWKTATDVLINALAEALGGPALLVLDDFHLVQETTPIATIVNRLIGYAPDELHVIVAGRNPPRLPGLVVWRARGELLEIDHRDLAFTDDEVLTLFGQRGYPLGAGQLEAVMAETEGWAIALQLLWQGLRSGAITDVTRQLDRQQGGTSLDVLFDYLAQEVLNRQPMDIQGFLLDTAVLQQLSVAACDGLRQAHNSAALLSYLHERDLFVVDLGDGHSRYHHLFQSFLRNRLAVDRARQLDRSAADYFSSVGEDERAIHHLLSACAHDAAAKLIDGMGERLVYQGRLDTLAGWIDRLPPKILASHPPLMIWLGDISRLRSEFDQALGWYTQAETLWRAQDDRTEISRALQRQALVYLDTVRPAQAESLLAAALRLSEGQQDREDHARLLELVAENKLNMGQPQEAEHLRAEARQWREEGPSERQIYARVLIRTGQLDRARELLEAQLEDEGLKDSAELSRAHRSHREAHLLLSLVYAFQGEAAAALRAAQAGVAIGQQLDSPFVTAVGYMRSGHAWLIHPQPDAYLKAIECFRQAITLGDVVAVRRTRVEAQWGLCRAYGYHGDLKAAQEAAALGVEIGRRAGDLWVVALIELTLGASYVLAGRHTAAAEILPQVLGAFRDCSDSYGRSAALLWSSLAYAGMNQTERMIQAADELLSLVESYNYGHLFWKRALLAPPDNRMLVPPLLEMRRRHRRLGMVNRLLAGMGLPRIEFHPGYQLRVRTLGLFQVWRGEEEIETREWRRIKARQLFQLLLTQRGQMLQREEVMETLWPGLDPDAGQRDFKVALNALNRALEPEREAGAESAYVVRQGSSYGLRTGADIWLDTELFESLIEEGDRAPSGSEARVEAFQAALELYEGDYLQEALYEDWASAERERLSTLYLRTAEKLAAIRVRQGRYDQAIDLCRDILSMDDCWERAYRLMMIAYARQGNRPRALRVYRRCRETLQQALGADPGAITERLHEQIRRGAPAEEWSV
jgi:LuxR family maltose regulon positive regulatory protein